MLPASIVCVISNEIAGFLLWQVTTGKVLKQVLNAFDLNPVEFIHTHPKTASASCVESAFDLVNQLILIGASDDNHSSSKFFREVLSGFSFTGAGRSQGRMTFASSERLGIGKVELFSQLCDDQESTHTLVLIGMVHYVLTNLCERGLGDLANNLIVFQVESAE